MSTQALFQNIANFLKVLPRQVECWANISVEAKYKENPLMIAEIIRNVINCLPFDSYKKVVKLNSVWKAWAHDDLYRRQEKLVNKYWDTIKEEKEVWKELDKAWENGPSEKTTRLSQKFEKLSDEKRETFAEQVRVEQAILDCGFADVNEREKIWRHINLIKNRFTPDDVGWTRDNEIIYHWDDEPEWDSSYWGDEDPDE